MNPSSSALSINEVSAWMIASLKSAGSLYQQEVVDFLVKTCNEYHLKENADGNLVLSTKVINKFRTDSGENVVWVKPDKYWRYRVTEDEPGREARG